MPNQARRARWSNLDLGFLTLDLRSSQFYFTALKYHFNSFTLICLVVFVLPRLLTIGFVYLTDKLYTNPKLSLINVPALNYLLRSQIFVNDDRQLRAVHLILDFEPISRSFLDVGNSIRADDHRLARIDVSWPNFLTPYDLPPVDHPIPQGIPLAAQPLQQVPLGEAIIGEGIAYSSSLEQEIDRFKFEEETILISEAEEGADEHSCVQTPIQVVFLLPTVQTRRKQWPRRPIQA